MDLTIRSTLVAQLFEDLSFAEQLSNRDRVEYILKHKMSFEKLNRLVKSNSDLSRSKTAKSLVKAKQFKAEADLFAKKADSVGEEFWELALQSYSKAILYTPNSEAHLLGKLFARKSQAHTAKKESEAALYSISLAIEITGSVAPVKLEYAILRVAALKTCRRYREALAELDHLLEHEETRICEKNPQTRQEDLHSLKRTIQELIQEQLPDEESKDSVEHEYFNYRLDSRCKIEDSPVVGRHFMATGDIKEGEVLLEERPYCTVLSAEYQHLKCNNCFAELGFKFFPCSGCTETIYCDRKCAKEAYETYHQKECGLISLLYSISHAQSLQVFRMITQVGGPLAAFDTERWMHQTAYSISDYLAEEAQRDRREGEKTLEERIRAYAMSNSLVAHDSAHGNTDNVFQAVASLELACLLDLIYGFTSERPGGGFFLDLAAMLVVDLRRISFNVFGWQAWADADNSKLNHVAHAQCLVGSLVNHSCVANTSWDFTEQGLIRFVANRPIKVNEEITISYGTHGSQSYSSRQKRLNSYYFACACEACFTDARRGSVLKCTACSGPVPYDTPANSEPELNGKCLLCYRVYENFDDAINRINGAQVALNVMQGLAVVGPNGSLLSRAVKQLETITELSMSSSALVQKSMQNCSRIIEEVGVEVFEATISLEKRLDLALIMQRYLTEVKVKEKKGHDTERCMSALQFWFDRLLSLIGAFSSGHSFNPYESELWSATFAVFNSLKQSIELLCKAPDNSVASSIEVLATLARHRADANERALKQTLADYGQDRLLLQGLGAGIA